jgi:ribosome biogenesis GTPase
MSQLGWDAARAADFAAFDSAGHSPGRVIRPDRAIHVVATANGETPAEVAPHLLRASIDRTALPTVGDWVALRRDSERATIDAVLPRRSAFLRRAAGNETVAHVLAANIDTVFVVVPLNRNPNLTRVERFLTLAWESGATPVLLLAKADLCDTLDEVLDEAASVAPGVDVHAVSAVTGDGVAALAPYLGIGRTVVLLGQSGAGKSTLANALRGAEVMATQDIRSDGRGRHTTTHRELMVLPDGGVLIDTPGLRTLLLWNADEGLDRAFSDVEALAAQCRFNDCGHTGEPGCAVGAAIASGQLAQRRLDSHQKLQKELAFLARKQDHRLRAEERKKWKAISKSHRQRLTPPR